MISSDIQITPEYKHCLDLIDDGTDILFVSGKAGTGKSVFIQVLRETYSHREMAVLAPTGVAALNVGGMTIHKMFLLPPMFTMPLFAIRHAGKLSRSSRGPLIDTLEILIIDEISMVRADTLDTLNKTLQIMRHNKKPFGGIQIVIIGDIFQLPPVFSTNVAGYADYIKLYQSEFFFHSEIIMQQQALGMMKTVVLDKIFRQQDNIFIDILNNIRNGTELDTTVQVMNEICYNENATEEEIMGNTVLCTTNGIALNINNYKLHQLSTEEYVFDATTSGKFNTRDTITPEKLTLKVGAKIMMTKNDMDGQYINGSMGTVVKIQHHVINVALDHLSEVISVERVLWENIEPHFNPEQNHIEERVVGNFKQFPMMLAWAVTIHKSQGLTFDNLSVDLGQGAFVSGQAYVALSRCTSIDGIVLVSPLHESDIIVNPEIVKFYSNLEIETIKQEE